jgi:hypothetical protein
MRPPRGSAPAAAAARGADTDQSNGNTKSRGGRPPQQGNLAPARNKCQPAPHYADPPGTAAMRLLGNLWGPPRIIRRRGRR